MCVAHWAEWQPGEHFKRATSSPSKAVGITSGCWAPQRDRKARCTTEALQGKGIAVDFLITVDPVGSVDGLLSWDQVMRWKGGDLNCPTYWVNSYNMNLADAVVDIPIPVVSHLLGGLLGGAIAAASGGNIMAGMAQAGDRWGSESGAVNYELDVGHENASDYLGRALQDPVLRSALVDTRILK